MMLIAGLEFYSD